MQYRLNDVSETIRSLADNNKRKDEWGYSNDYSEETLAEFKKAIGIIQQAEVYIHRIDWLVSGDDGEDNFHIRLKEDLEKL